MQIRLSAVKARTHRSRREKMSDSIDRVFSKAVTTIKTLSVRSGYGSLPRPPLDNRIKLYGLYKQATEGNIPSSLSSQLRDSSNMTLSAEDEVALKKYHSWYVNLNLSKTEAKKKYIEVLIHTMKVYASGTVESRELLNELEDLYEQIKDLHSVGEDEVPAGVPELKSPELLYNPPFKYPLNLRNASSSSNNLIDTGSIYDKNDSIYSFHIPQSGNNNSIGSTDPSWRNEINSIIGKMIKDLNFFKKLERQRQLDHQRSQRFKYLSILLKFLGYSIANLVLLVLILKLDKKRQFIKKLIG